MITIATSRHFLICESVNHITLHKEGSGDFGFDNPSSNSYVVCINFNPTIPRSNSGLSRNQDTTESVSIRVLGEAVALKFFKEIVKQIREQCPDAAYLDRMVENLLSGENDIHDEPSAETSSGTRQKKRRSKKVLRGTSGSNKASSFGNKLKRLLSRR